MYVDNKKLECFGSCHCQEVRFSIRVPEKLNVIKCMCSICSQSGFLHINVSSKHFNLLQGSEYLNEYRFNTKQAKHLFCRRCGIKAFYHPRSSPDNVAVNYRCLQLPKGVTLHYHTFDGRNWEQNIETFKEFIKHA